MFIPETKIRTNQMNKTNKVCPISGCKAKNKTIIDVVRKEKKYFKWIFLYFSLLKIILIKIIKNGLTSSIGWNLGKNCKSIHLFEPLTSIPITGTKNKKINEIKKIINENFNNFSWFIDEKIKIKNIPKKIKVKCLKKNK